MSKKIEDTFVWKGLLIVQRSILWVASLVVVVTITASVVMRYVLKTDLYGLEECITLLAMWIYFIGGAYGTYEGSHITADIMSVLVKNPRKMRMIKIFIAVVSLGISIFFAMWGLQYWKLVLRLGGRTPGMHIPLPLQKIPLVICFILMIAYNLFHLICLLMNRRPIILDQEVQEPLSDKGDTEA